MKHLIAALAILLPFISCHQDVSAPIKNSSSINKKEASLQLNFTTGIWSIFEDSKGNYWLGSDQEGVAMFDGHTLSYFTKNEGLSDNQIRSIQEDKEGNIWLETGKGVNRYDGKEITNFTPSLNNGLQGERRKKDKDFWFKTMDGSTNYIPTINRDLPNKWTKRANDLWFNAGNKEGIYRYDGQQVEYLAFPQPKIINPNNVYHVTSFSEGKNDMRWIGTYAGIFGYDGTRFTLINDETLRLKEETGLLHIRSLLEDSKGRLWIGNNGMGVLLKENGATINFSEKHNLIHSTSLRRGDKSPAGTLEHVFTIEEDKDGNIWFGDRDTGIWKYNGRTMKNYTKKDGLTNDFAQTIYKDKKGELWFGMGDGNVFKLDGATFKKQFGEE